MHRKINLDRLIDAYRSLVLEEARLRLANSFPPFVASLTLDGGGGRLLVQEVDAGKTSRAKDEFVTQVQADAQSCKAVAVWFGARGWNAPDWSPRPSKHPQGRRMLLLFESTQTKRDRLWQAMVMQDRGDGTYRCGRWCSTDAKGGRFVNLLGSGPRMVP